MPLFFFFNDTATTEIYTLSLHDALPICELMDFSHRGRPDDAIVGGPREVADALEELFTERVNSSSSARSEEHTSELQSRSDLVCRLLLEKKKKEHQQTQNQRKYTSHIDE